MTKRPVESRVPQPALIGSGLPPFAGVLKVAELDSRVSEDARSKVLTTSATTRQSKVGVSCVTLRYSQMHSIVRLLWTWSNSRASATYLCRSVLAQHNSNRKMVAVSSFVVRAW